MYQPTRPEVSFKLPVWSDWHKTRKAGATALAMAGASPDDLKKAGRWTNIKTANRYLDDIQSIDRLRTLAEKAFG